MLLQRRKQDQAHHVRERESYGVPLTLGSMWAVSPKKQLRSAFLSPGSSRGQLWPIDLTLCGACIIPGPKPFGKASMIPTIFQLSVKVAFWLPLKGWHSSHWQIK